MTYKISILKKKLNSAIYAHKNNQTLKILIYKLSAFIQAVFYVKKYIKLSKEVSIQITNVLLKMLAIIGILVKFVKDSNVNIFITFKLTNKKEECIIFKKKFKKNIIFILVKIMMKQSFLHAKN